MKGTYLGEFEELVLLTVGILQQEGAYGSNVLEEIEARTSRSVNLSAVHSALQRLVDKRFLKREKGEATAVRGGKRKIYYQLTTDGVQVIQQVRELRDGLWQAIPNVVINGK